MPMSKPHLDPSWVDPDDAPDLSTPDWQAKFAQADLYQGDRVVRRGRPPLAEPKVSTTIRLSAEVIDHFKTDGPGWQSRIDAALKDWIAQRRAG
jgi:uncharacterized protein (DUF4415 family)